MDVPLGSDSSPAQYIRPPSCNALRDDRPIPLSAGVLMSKAPRSEKQSAGSAGKSRPSSGGPAKPRPDLSDALESKADATEGLALARPFNELKRAEFDPAAHVEPLEGPAFEPDDPAATGSTVSESNASDKVGSGAPVIGTNRTIAPLDRVRADASG